MRKLKPGQQNEILMDTDLPFSDRAKGFVALIAKDGGSSSYNKWANSYEEDVTSMNYSGYKSVVQKWQSYNSDLSACFQKTGAKHKVFDAGCGTGLAGEMLVSSVSPDLLELYGGDISEKMIEVARTKTVYKDLQIINLKRELPYEADSFDSVLCAGVFGLGHCGPECVPNIIRVLKPGGYFIATVNKELFDTTVVEWRRITVECSCELIEESEMPYRDCAMAFVLVIHKTS